MGEYSEESSRTLWVGNLHEKVTEEILFELFLQAGPLEKVALPTGKRYAFVIFQHPESVMYSKELMEGVQLFGQHLNLQPRNQSSSASNAGHQMPGPLIGQAPVSHLMSPPLYPVHAYSQGHAMYGQQYNQFANSQFHPDSQRLNRLQEDVQRQLATLAAMNQTQQLTHQQGYGRHDTGQWRHAGHRGFH